MSCTSASVTRKSQRGLTQTPEGHAVDFDADGNVIGMVLVNVRWLMDREGKLRITWPDGHVSQDAPTDVLPSAA